MHFVIQNNQSEDNFELILVGFICLMECVLTNKMHNQRLF